MQPAAMPRFGAGTWRMGERASERPRELAAVRAALDLGVRLVDTAEMYGDGNAEAIVGEAMRGRREGVYVVSKCYPHHAGAKTMPKACERSLARLNLDRIDCYLLHWRGRVPLAETVETFEKLVDRGLIARWGVSNFDIEDMNELFAVPGGDRCAANQVLYHAGDRAVETGLLELCRSRQIPLMAYSPLGQGELLRKRAFASIAKSAQLTPAQLALAFVMSREGVVAIPKSSSPERMRENVDAQAITLDASTLARIDEAFPPPSGRTRISLA
jgi:diketogulonate reductase-like aldo/keto reductase